VVSDLMKVQDQLALVEKNEKKKLSQKYGFY